MTYRRLNGAQALEAMAAISAAIAFTWSDRIVIIPPGSRREEERRRESVCKAGVTVGEIQTLSKK